MEYFVVYDRATGAHLWRGSGQEGATALQMLPDDVDAGIVTISHDQARQPWDSYGLRLLQDIAWADVKARRDVLINGGAMTPSGAVDSDAAARLNIAGAVQAATISKAAAQPFEVDWTMLDNSTVTLDADAMIALGLAVMQHINNAHDAARSLRAQIEGAADIPALLEINLGD